LSYLPLFDLVSKNSKDIKAHVHGRRDGEEFENVLLSTNLILVKGTLLIQKLSLWIASWGQFQSMLINLSLKPSQLLFN